MMLDGFNFLHRPMDGLSDFFYDRFLDSNQTYPQNKRPEGLEEGEHPLCGVGRVVPFMLVEYMSGPVARRIAVGHMQEEYFLVRGPVLNNVLII